MKAVLLYALVFLAFAYTLNQVRKPTRRIGGFLAWIMNISHS
jgi:hypothetical protein